MPNVLKQLVANYIGKYPQERALFVLLLFTSCCLSFRYAGGEWLADRFYQGAKHGFFSISTWENWLGEPVGNLPQLISWAGVQYLFLLVLPGLFLLIFRKSRTNMFKLPRTSASWMPYLLLFFCMILPLILAAQLESFQTTYPFLRFGTSGFSWKLFLLWELVYLIQFVAVEYFFRGFLLLGMLPILGEAVMAVSIVPYVMIHFGKPIPEVLGAAIAGWILAKLALRTGSIVPGIALHFSIALSMDVLSLYLKGII
jgi:membrane protease YdiL (CAAX protease family)